MDSYIWLMLFLIYWIAGMIIVVNDWRKDDAIYFRDIGWILGLGLVGVLATLIDFFRGYKDYVLIKQKKTDSENTQ